MLFAWVWPQTVTLLISACSWVCRYSPLHMAPLRTIKEDGKASYRQKIFEMHILIENSYLMYRIAKTQQ
jgi:hypothetical protein